MQRREAPSTETTWYICLLTLALVFGACARFYGIDQLGLTFNELNVLATCDDPNWLDMAINYNSRTGMTPLYPTLLCEVTDWSSRAEVFVRLLSVLTGLGIMFVIYMIGRDFISPIAGLFAAALVALDYQMIITSRDASVYSLLTLLLLLHHYYFCQLFFANNRYTRQACAFRIAGHDSQMLWHWQPDFPGDARTLAGFWITGLLAFYTNPMAILPLATELLASFYLLRRAGLSLNIRSTMRTLWLPVAIGLLPWLPIMDHYRHWALDGNLFGWPENLSFLRLAGDLLLIDSGFHIGLFALAILSFVLVWVQQTKDRDGTLATLLIYMVLLVLVAVASLAFIKPASPLSFLYIWVMLLLLTVAPAAILLERLNARHLQRTILMGLLFLVVVAQTRSNNAAFLYKRGTDADFRLAARILQADQGFMNGHREVFQNHRAFDHYLDRYGITRQDGKLVNARQPTPDFHQAITDTSFYYLEFRANMTKNFAETNASRDLKDNYSLLCESRMGRIRLFKFSRIQSVTTNETSDCRSYLLHMSGM